MYALNAITTGNSYTDANTLQCPGTNEVIITVEENPVLVQFAFRSEGYSQRAPIWTPSEGILLVPGFHTRGRRIEQVRIKSYKEGEPGLVNIEAVT